MTKTIEKMWVELAKHQPVADKLGYGPQWQCMCGLKTEGAAEAAWAAAEAAWAAAEAAWAAAEAAADAAWADAIRAKAGALTAAAAEAACRNSTN